MSAANPPADPIYADRVSGRSFPNAREMINHYLGVFAEHAGIERVELDASGHVLLARGSASIGVNVLEGQGVLMIFAPIMDVPVTGREALYRRLLELSFLATADGAFAIADDKVVVRTLRRLSSLDYEEFEDLLRTVGEIADEWDDRLIADFGT